jgi:hypothetical protein
MTAAIEKWGKETQESQTRELSWQKSVDGNTAKIKQFQEIAGALRKFKSVLFVISQT